MILLALTQTAAILKISSINTQRTAILIHTLATVNYLLPRGETLFHLPLINILEIFKDFPSAPENIQRLFIDNPKVFKDFFACKFVLAANHQQPENIQRLFRLQNCLSRKSSAPEKSQRLFHLQNCLCRKSSAPENIQRLFRLQNCLSCEQPTISRKCSKTFWPAISSIDQQHQPAAATNSNQQQQQQPAAAINSSNQQQQQPASVLPAVSTQSMMTFVSYSYGS